MERKEFVKLSLTGLAAFAFSMLAGCGKTDKTPKLANQEKFWLAAMASEKGEEPTDLAYVKNTPALYKDASFGKEDPNFKPKTGGG